MDSPSPDARVAFEAELTRLGLDKNDLPGLVVSSLDRLVEHLRGLEPGATWSDVFPDLPKGYVPGQPRTWRNRYVPRGPFDYQELPTGPAIHIAWDKAVGRAFFDPFVASARAAGWPIYGAGVLPMTDDPQWPTANGMIILTHGTSEDTLFEFKEWIERRTDVSLAGIPRLGSETYTES